MDGTLFDIRTLWMEGCGGVIVVEAIGGVP